MTSPFQWPWHEAAEDSPYGRSRVNELKESLPRKDSFGRQDVVMTAYCDKDDGVIFKAADGTYALVFFDYKNTKTMRPELELFDSLDAVVAKVTAAYPPNEGSAN